VAQELQDAKSRLSTTQALLDNHSGDLTDENKKKVLRLRHLEQLLIMVQGEKQQLVHVLSGSEARVKSLQSKLEEAEARITASDEAAMSAQSKLAAVKVRHQLCHRLALSKADVNNVHTDAAGAGRKG
jgi:peptidoglycan hydrolase CwlO-like protein